MRLIRDAWLDLRAHRVRSTLAALGLLVAILSLVGVTTLGTVVRDVFVSRDEQLNGRMWTMIGSVDYGVVTPQRLAGIVDELDRQVAATGGTYALEAELVGEVTPVHDGGGTGAPGVARIVLVAADLDQVRRLPVLDGGWLPPPEQVFPGGVVLNREAGAAFGGVGARVRISLASSTLPYEQHVIGVVGDGRGEPRIYQSLHTALHYQPSIASVDGGLSPDLLVHYPGVSEAAIRGKVEDVAHSLGVPPDALQVRPASSLADYLSSLRQTQLAFTAVSAVTLVVAMIGLLNIGLATLRERVRELSLRRAVGATRSRVFALVLATTVVLSGIVAVVAIAVAYAGVQWLVPALLDPGTALQPPGFPWEAALYGGLAALLAGIAGGVVPALAAARVDVIRILRE